jgi:hypothetical protein
MHLLARARQPPSVHAADLRLALPGLPHPRPAVLQPRRPAIPGARHRAAGGGAGPAVAGQGDDEGRHRPRRSRPRCRLAGFAAGCGWAGATPSPSPHGDGAVLPGPPGPSAVRPGASWTADHHLQLTVAAVAGPVLVVLVAQLSWLVGRPDGGCPAQRPAGIQRSGVVAVVGKARTPATASVAGPRPPCGVHSAVPPSCPAVQRPAPSGVQRVRCPPVRCPPVRWSAGLLSAPSVRTPPSHPTSGGGVGDQVGAAGNLHHRNGSRSRWAVTPWSGSVDGRAGPDAGDAAGVARWSVGRWRTRAGLGEGGDA